MSSIPSLTSATTPVPPRATDLRELDMDHFLKLMITELQNQDPLNPMENSEILQQIGHIRSIGATNQLSETLGAVLIGQNLSTASSLIGKEVTALSDTKQNIQGIVDRVSIEANDDGQRRVRVHIGHDAVSLDGVRAIVHGQNDAQ